MFHWNEMLTCWLPGCKFPSGQRRIGATRFMWTNLNDDMAFVHSTLPLLLNACETSVFQCACNISFGMHIDWLQSLKQFFINVSYHILVASLTLMALFENRAIRVRLARNVQVYDITHC